MPDHGSPGRFVELFDDTGALRWSGDLRAGEGALVLPVPGSQDAIVLLGSPVSGQASFRNLLRVTADGAIVWRAQLPSDRDTFVSVEWAGATLMANAWNGYRVEVDALTGQLLQSVFTK